MLHIDHIVIVAKGPLTRPLVYPIRRVVITADTIDAIGAALSEGKTTAEILAALPRKRKTKR